MNKKLTFILFSFLAVNLYGQNLHISGSFKNISDSTILLRFRADPLTSERDDFITTLDKNGNFQFSYELKAPVTVTFVIGESGPLFAHLIVFPNSKVNIFSDCDNFKNTLKITGDYQTLTNIRSQLFSHNFVPDTTYLNFEYQDWQMFEYNLKSSIRSNLGLLDSLHKEYSLTKIEYDYAWAELYYHYFDSYAYHTWKLKIPQTHKVYSFLDRLDLTNDSIALIYNDYNSHVSFAILHKYKKQNNLLLERSNPDSAFFYNQYEFGKKQVSGTVRDIFLTRLLFRVLSQGVPGADHLYSKYLNDCNSTNLKTIIKQEYNLYILVKNKETEVNYEIIKDPDDDIDKFLARYKGKVLLLEFWGSWCSPCIKVIPRIKTIEERFNSKEFQVIHIAVRDTYEKMMFAIEKYNIGGVNILLPKSVDAKWKEKIDYYTVPYYAIVDRNGIIVEDGPLAVTHLNELTNTINEIIE